MGAWVALSFKPPTSAQAIISRFVSSRPALGSLLSAQEPLQTLCPPPSLPSPVPNPTHALFISKINIKKKYIHIFHKNNIQLSFFCSRSWALLNVLVLWVLEIQVRQEMRPRRGRAQLPGGERPGDPMASEHGTWVACSWKGLKYVSFSFRFID